MAVTKPVVENADIMVGGDGSHQAGDCQCGAILLGNVWNLHPVKDSARSHAGDSKRKSIVHGKVLAISDVVWQRCHGLRRPLSFQRKLSSQDPTVKHQTA